MTSTEPWTASPAPFPAQSRTSNTSIQGIPTTTTSLLFSDRILLTLSQTGRINHWIHVPLAHASLASLLPAQQPPSYSETGPDASLLPMNRLTATTVLGGTKPELETVGTTLATTVGSAVVMRNGEEGRTLVLGLGLASAEVDRVGFDGLVGACLDVL